MAVALHEDHPKCGRWRLLQGVKKVSGYGTGVPSKSARVGGDCVARGVSCVGVEEAFLREQHQLYGIVANSGECGIPALLHSPDFLLKNTAAIEANSGDYTSWYLRRRYFSLNPEALDEEELRYCREVCLASIKNYQAWFHRRWLLQRLPPSCFSIEEELDSLKEASSLDLKNYSCWAHRRYARVFEAQPSNESLVRFLLGCLKAAAAVQEQHGLSQPEFQEAVDTLLNVAARVATVAEGGERFALEVGVAADCLRHNYRAAQAKCMRLKTTDPIRRFYWAWRAMLLGKKDLALQILCQVTRLCRALPTAVAAVLAQPPFEAATGKSANRLALRKPRKWAEARSKHLASWKRAGPYSAPNIQYHPNARLCATQKARPQPEEVQYLVESCEMSVKVTLAEGSCSRRVDSARAAGYGAVSAAAVTEYKRRHLVKCLP
ncbi:uncharacterized protein LOC34618063 [Cyclospora cayetanensis]|uniref:Uncharacterized protein LOC34618063 n=1 Tax=Cyclospora cayetanensis TaxID=88456 RepID=A0A6P6RS75_9EIME|nr:uncharacterized protein LOC34618063 [Cyclospora cayetanensis]